MRHSKTPVSCDVLQHQKLMVELELLPLVPTKTGRELGKQFAPGCGRRIVLAFAYCLDGGESLLEGVESIDEARCLQEDSGKV